MLELIYENNNLPVGKYSRKVVKSHEAETHYAIKGWTTIRIYEDLESDEEESELEIIMYRKDYML